MSGKFTVIQGYQVTGTTNGDGAIRCVYLADGASLSGFTLTKGATSYNESGYGGRVWCEASHAVVSNCVLTGNSAGESGGGAFQATLNNCTLTDNSAQEGGGAVFSTLNDCRLSGNSATFGGGVFASTLNNCSLTGNSASWAVGGAAGYPFLMSVGCVLNNCIVYYNAGGNHTGGGGCQLNYCCTTPMPEYGVGNIANAPLFVDYAGGNLRLQSNSLCINAGHNAYAPGIVDLDGQSRIVSGTVDIGAYEFQGPGSVISYAWLQQFGLPTDGSADATDLDLDGHTTWQEWRCLTDPSNTLSAWLLVSASPTGTNVTITWQSVAGVNYVLERSTNLASPFAPLATDIPGQPGTTSLMDTNAAGLAPLFYRVAVP